MLKKRKKHENYQQTKGVRISLHAYLTSVGWNQTPNNHYIPKAVLRSNQRFLSHSLLAWIFYNTPLRIIWNNQVSKQCCSWFSFIFPLSINSKERMVHLNIICPYLSIVGAIKMTKTGQRLSFCWTSLNIISYWAQFWVVYVKEHVNSGEHFRTGDLSKVNCSPVHKRKICFLWENNIQCPLPNLVFRKGCKIQMHLHNSFQIKLEEQKCLLLSICSSAGIVFFCLLISERKFGEKNTVNACLPLNTANNKMEPECPRTQETK